MIIPLRRYKNSTHKMSWLVPSLIDGGLWFIYRDWSPIEVVLKVTDGRYSVNIQLQPHEIRGVFDSTGFKAQKHAIELIKEKHSRHRETKIN